jgi:uncharacterized membrane protein YjfL (UPF0719 family)
LLSISPFTFFLLVLVVAVIGTTLGFMLKDRITSRLSIRNISRRKATVALVISGLLVGTTMISGSLVTEDTMTDLFGRGAYFTLVLVQWMKESTILVWEVDMVISTTLFMTK